MRPRIGNKRPKQPTKSPQISLPTPNRPSLYPPHGEDHPHPAANGTMTQDRPTLQQTHLSPSGNLLIETRNGDDGLLQYPRHELLALATF